jgi:hypothetical protein
MDKISKAILNLESYIQGKDFKGYDPYDGLMSPIFSLPVLKSNHTIRFLAQQFIKRFPLDLRPVLRVKESVNPVTIGLCIQGYAELVSAFPEKKEEYESMINELLGRLEGFIPTGFSGSCWGYDFDWAARNANIPAYQPTVVATGIITNALYRCYLITQNEKAKELLLSSENFVLSDLNQTTDKDGDICFSYSPFDKQIVFNASLKGARLLAQCYSLNGRDESRKLAQKAISFVMKNQRNDGAWIYSKAKEGGWVDNYHTGYVLDCAHDYTKLTGDNSFMSQIDKGFLYYKENFILPSGMPKFYDKETYPVDCTSASQSIFTLTRFNEPKLAEKVAIWMIENMQKENGSFCFRKYSNYINKKSFMRWSDAWMFASLAYFLSNQSNYSQNQS